MDSPFHPELRRAAAFLPRTAVGPRLVPIIRGVLAQLERVRPSGLEVADLGEITVRVHRPDSAGPHPALLWIHGGGMVIGTAAQDDKLCRYFADTTGCVVAAVNYRLAPEHRFPVPLDDCYRALEWLADLPDVDRERVAIGGASAGGGLAASLALLVKERGLLTPVLQLLVYPMLDDRTVLRADPDDAQRRLWNNRSNAYGWSSYTGLAPGAAQVSTLAAPGRHDDLEGVAPAWIGVGTLDLFHDEDVAYAEALRAAGVACELDVIQGAFHGFDGVVSKSEVARAFRAAQTRALADAFAG